MTNLEEYHTGILRTKSSVIDLGVLEFQLIFIFMIGLIIITEGKLQDWTLDEVYLYFYPTSS